jgi:predicted transcriptional regulator YheO
MPNALLPYLPVCEAIARLFQPYVEVVLHDLATGKIAHIANSYSKRKVGDSSLLESEPGFAEGMDVIGPYPKSRWDGRRLKSITAVLRDGRKRAVGLLCINYDVENFSEALQQLKRLIDLPAPVETPRQLMSKDRREAVNTTVGQFLRSRNVTLAGLTSQDRDELLETLRSEGLFEIRNAVPYVAGILGLTRATIYNRLRAKQQSPRPGRRETSKTRGSSSPPP